MDTLSYDISIFVQAWWLGRIRIAEAAGPENLAVAEDLMRTIVAESHTSPWSRTRRVEWQDHAELSELFESERLQTLHGNFIDQRFIDYLSVNQDKIAFMNWRKFEALVAEHFGREGYSVAMGPGRGDDGVDIRLWRENEASGPPAILVQCKREARKISKVVVKALWADVMDAKAESGLIVTSSSLSPGARKVCQARSYPIAAVDKTTLSVWIMALRTPGSGVFLSE